jgi:tetratricopeptide (TPR) repeat protein
MRIKRYNVSKKCLNTDIEIVQIHNLCRWDLCWSYALKGNWSAAADCALVLSKESKWSPATNMYQHACFLHMLSEEENRPELKPLVRESMLKVIDLRIRYVGRTLPPEKFAITKAERFLKNDQALTLPIYELFYIWNVFGHSQESGEHLEKVLVRVQFKLDQLIVSKSESEDRFVMLFLKGVILRNLKRSQEAIDCFVPVIKNQDSIDLENYLPPHAAFELGMALMDIGDYEESKVWLEKARDDYTGFLVETLVHLRIHGALQKLRDLTK